MRPILIDSGFAALAFAIVTVSSPALAEPPTSTTPTIEDRDEARARFSRGVELFREGNFGAALIEFNRAYEAVPNFNVLYNIGQACIELRDAPAALRALEKYLSEGGDQIAPARRSEVEADIEKLRARVGYLHVKVMVANAEVTIDDVVIGRSPIDTEISVNAGRRKVAVSVSELQPVIRMVDVGVGEHAAIEIGSAADTPAPQPLPPPPPPLAVGAVSSSPSSLPTWIGLAATGVLAAGTAVAGAATLSAKDTLDQRVHAYPTTARAVEDARSDAKTMVLVTNVLGGATIVTAGITTVLFVTRKSEPKRASAQIGVAPGGMVVFGRF